MSKDCFGNELPTYKERLALARGAKMCIEAGELTPEALALLEDADDERLRTYLEDTGFIIMRSLKSMADWNAGLAHMMEYEVCAMFKDSPDIQERLCEVDESQFNTIWDYLQCAEKQLDHPRLHDAFFSLFKGYDIETEIIVQHRVTGEIVKSERIAVKAHDALRRTALTAQIVIAKDTPQEFFDGYIKFLTQEAEQKG